MRDISVRHTADGKLGEVIWICFDTVQTAIILIVVVRDGTNALAGWLLSACTFVGE